MREDYEASKESKEKELKIVKSDLGKTYKEAKEIDEFEQKLEILGSAEEGNPEVEQDIKLKSEHPLYKELKEELERLGNETKDYKKIAGRLKERAEKYRKELKEELTQCLTRHEDINKKFNEEIPEQYVKKLVQVIPKKSQFDKMKEDKIKVLQEESSVIKELEEKLNDLKQMSLDDRKEKFKKKYEKKVEEIKATIKRLNTFTTSSRYKDLTEEIEASIKEQEVEREAASENTNKIEGLESKIQELKKEVERVKKEAANTNKEFEERIQALEKLISPKEEPQQYISLWKWVTSWFSEMDMEKMHNF